MSINERIWRRLAARQTRLFVVGLCGAAALFLLLRVTRLPVPTAQPDIPLDREVGLLRQIPQSDLPIADAFAQNQPIWVDTVDPTTPTVGLFRYAFTADQSFDNVSLHIFADTRYEVWLDGIWQGRGPARFSRLRHEYDSYELGALMAGEHQVAVLVQWAPNIRRSESTTPHLMAQIQTVSAAGTQILTRTGTDWKALASVAWRTDAGLVHSWNLLGPTELLDLRSLPVDWMLPGFDDRGWPHASRKVITEPAHYAPRSIPLLANVPFTAILIDAGELSPGRMVGQLMPTVTTPVMVTLRASQLATATVEMLIEPETITPTALLDGTPLTWTAAGDRRPDVQIATLTLQPGQHQLVIPQIPPTGLPLALSTHAIQATLPFTQGNHAGRRLLLAEPITNSTVVKAMPKRAAGQLALDFRHAPTYAVLDLGRVVHGRLVADVRGPAGTVVDIGWDERLLPGTLRPLPAPGTLHPEWNQTDSWILDGTQRRISTLDARAGRYLLIAVWGKAPVRLDNLQVYEERYPVVQRGWFRSSNPRLDAIWQLGVNTTYPSMQDAYADPWRERGQWWGDAYVTDHVNQAVFGDTGLLRRGLLFLAEATHDGQVPGFAPNSDGGHPLDYSMLWAQSLQDYLVLTDDESFVQELYPTLRALMADLDRQRNPDSGLIDLPKGHWSQTAVVDWAGYHSRYGQSTVLNALYYGTLLDAALIAERLGETMDGADWRQTAQAVKVQMNKLLYLPQQHQYVTTIANGVSITPTTHAQVWPLAFDIVPASQIDKVVDTLLPAFHLEIFGMYWGLAGLGHAGRIDAATQLIESQYGKLLDAGATTLWEHWDSNLRYQAALSHNWGAGPTWFLTTYVLGAQRTGPSTWRVQPAFAGVQSAAGAIPLQTGELGLAWHWDDCQTKIVTVTAPPTSKGEVILSVENVKTIRLNDQTIWPGPTEAVQKLTQIGEQIQFPLPGGDYEIEVKSVCAS